MDPSMEPEPRQGRNIVAPGASPGSKVLVPGPHITPAPRCSLLFSGVCIAVRVTKGQLGQRPINPWLTPWATLFRPLRGLRISTNF